MQRPLRAQTHRGFFDLAAQAFGDLAGVDKAGVGQGDQKFFAADPRNQITDPQIAQQPD